MYSGYRPLNDKEKEAKKLKLQKEMQKYEDMWREFKKQHAKKREAALYAQFFSKEPSSSLELKEMKRPLIPSNHDTAAIKNVNKSAHDFIPAPTRPTDHIRI